MQDAGDKYSKALSKCGKDVTEPAEAWGKKMDELTHRIGWTEMEQKIYSDNKDAIDADVKLEFEWYDKSVFFNSGMYAGRIDKIFLDAAGPPPKFFHPFH